ncbi:MAG: tetratricopeptide repeat protein, partial [Dolichospermum sp.]
MRLLSMILRLLGGLLRSFIILLSIIFIGIPLFLLMLIFPSLRRKIESLNQSSASRSVYQSSPGVTLDIEIPNQQDYLNFLMETLQKISENPNPQVIYPFWAQNLDKLDDNLARILDSWARNTLTQATPEQAYFIAVYIGNFSNLICQFPLGDITTHKEIAITGYEIALTIFTFDAFPQNWAATQNNLAAAYSNRIRGNKAEKGEKAITAYTEALK